MAAQREREGVGCPGPLATPAKRHVSEGPRLRSAQVMSQAAEPALIPGPQTHEQIKWCGFRPLSFGEVCYTAVDTEAMLLVQ